MAWNLPSVLARFRAHIHCPMAVHRPFPNSSGSHLLALKRSVRGCRASGRRQLLGCCYTWQIAERQAKSQNCRRLKDTAAGPEGM